MFCLHDDNIFPLFQVIDNFKFISNFGPLQRMSRMTKHVIKACKVDPGDRVTLPVKWHKGNPFSAIEKPMHVENGKLFGKPFFPFRFSRPVSLTPETAL